MHLDGYHAERLYRLHSIASCLKGELQLFFIGIAWIGEQLVPLPSARFSLFKQGSCGDAAKCYVYLTDVSIPVMDVANKASWELAFQESRWFNRGWTLQELIAPTSVEFFSKEGVRLGDKKSLEHDIRRITGLPLDLLRGGPLSGYSVPERLAWIGSRETTRNEDRAYSLLGLCGVHMPLIYGEGE